ncbi:MAG TPA: Crp/Fnr family transcriptional regulator [Anaerolineae bacterium]|jgi:CRP-like cAMP-binding protein|nr:Crp/Fnr family transcriptional regulator [Anaerolineae bacterium]
MSDRLTTLQQLPLFSALSLDQIASFADRFRASTFDQNATIFLEGDPADRLWVIQEGQVKIVKYGEGGKENLLEVIMPGEMFGGAGILFPIHPASAVAMTAVAVLGLPRTEYLQLIRSFPDVALKIIAILGERLRAAMKMRAMSIERVDARLAHILLKLADKIGVKVDEGVRIDMSLSRQDLADMAGTTIETAIRIMSKFRKDGLVMTEPGGFIVIMEVDRLAALAEGQ